MKHIGNILILLVTTVSLSTCTRRYRMFYSTQDDSCIDRHNRHQRCIPDFVNAAFQKSITASSTCGIPAKEFCSLDHRCHTCDATQANASYPTRYLTDMNNPNKLTCWQSDQIKPGENVTLVLPLKKKFELTYISLQFCSENRPDSIAILKSMDMVSDRE
jgi:netrin 1